MNDQRTYLKIKIKSLAAEAKIIRAEEHKHTKCNEFGFNPIRWGLRDHRITVVRSEARHTLLAYGFLRGRTYRQIEPTSKDNPPNWEKVWKMVEKYGTREADQAKRFADWKTEDEAPRGLLQKIASLLG